MTPTPSTRLTAHADAQQKPRQRAIAAMPRPSAAGTFAGCMARAVGHQKAPRTGHAAAWAAVADGGAKHAHPDGTCVAGTGCPRDDGKDGATHGVRYGPNRTFNHRAMDDRF